MTDLLKNEAIRLASGLLIETPFNSVYSYADNLFDLKEMKVGDERLAQQVKFLKSTTLEQVEYANLDSSFFTIKNKSDSSFIALSNRASLKNEVRGVVLRNIIKAEKENNPKQFLYNLLSRALKSPKYSDSIVMIRGALVGMNAKNALDEAMTNEHFDLFINMVLAGVNKKIQSGVIKATIDPLDIRHDDELRADIVKDLNVEKLYELAKILTENNKLHDLSYFLLKEPQFLQNNQQLLPSLITLNNKIGELKLKSNSLKKGNYPVEANQVDSLVKKLNTEQEKFINGEITKNDFLKNSQKLVLAAKHSKLADLRGFGKIMFGILNILTAIATLGVANIITGRFSIFYKQTDTLSKVSLVDKALVNISEFDNDNKDDVLSAP